MDRPPPGRRAFDGRPSEGVGCYRSPPAAVNRRGHPVFAPHHSDFVKPMTAPSRTRRPLGLAAAPAVVIGLLALLPAAPAPAMDLAAQAAQAEGLWFRPVPRLLAAAELPPGHGHGQVGMDAPPLPFFVNFETGANVKALALKGRDLWLGLPNGLIRYNVDSYDDHEIFTVASTRAAGADGTARPGLLANGVYALDVAPDGALWVSTYGGGLSRLKDGKWTTYTPVEGLGDRWAYDVEFAPDGTLWIATWKGISHFDGTHFTTLTEADGLVDKWVYDVAVDPDGTVWAGTEGGVSVWDGKRFTSYTHADGLGGEVPEAARKPMPDADSAHHRSQGKANQGYNPNYVLAIATTPDGAKWFGTWGAGLSRFDGKGWTSHTAADGLGGNFVHALAVAPDGTLWAATDGGVSYLKEGAWITLDRRHGLLDDNVFSILFDPDGNAWFGTWKGLSKMTTPPPLPAGPHAVPPASPHG
jgi:ligand-binding sensor domain-containing protein